jgi:hypothetical protein
MLQRRMGLRLVELWKMRTSPGYKEGEDATTTKACVEDKALGNAKENEIAEEKARK